MNKNNNDFDVVSIDQKNTKSLVVFEINQVTKFVQKTSVGQFIKSQPFELNFPSSIGQSKWILMLFLNGQYEHGGKANENIFVYLKMVQCDPRQQSTVFKFDVTFQLGSEHGLVSKKNESLCYDNVRTRWIGTKLLNISEMISNGSRYIQNDTLMLSVFLNENLPKHVAAETWPSFNKTFMEKESYAKAVPETKTVSMPVNSSPPGHNRYSNSNQYNTGAAYDLYQNNNLPRNSYVASDSRTATGLNNIRKPVDNGRKSVYDGNANYVENEFSDDEDNSAKPPDGLVKKVVNNLISSLFGKSNSN